MTVCHIFDRTNICGSWAGGTTRAQFITTKFLNGFRRVLKFVDILDNYLFICQNINNIYAIIGLFHEFKIILNTAVKICANE